MSRKVKYTKEYLTTLWTDFQKLNKESNKKLKEYCKDNNLNYISIYTALRKNEVMTFLKKGKNKPAVPVAEPVQA